MLYIKRCRIIWRSFWYYFKGREWSCVGGNGKKTNLKLKFFTFRFWRHQWRHQYDEYLKWKRWVWSYSLRNLKSQWPPGSAREQNKNFTFSGSRVRFKNQINLICIFLESKFNDGLNPKNIFQIRPSNLFKSLISRNAWVESKFS